MQSKAASVEQYLAELPEDRRHAIEAVRKVIRKHLRKGYAEGMTYGMIGYFVPHSVYPAGYHCDPSKPLPFVSLASQKNHMAIYLMHVSSDAAQEKRFRERWAATGKKLDMGRSCLRFKRLDDVALDVVGESIASMPVKDYIALYEASLNAPRAKGPAKKAPAAKQGVSKRAPAKKSAATKKAGSTKAPAEKKAGAAKVVKKTTKKR